jgi:hypothetical protein
MKILKGVTRDVMTEIIRHSAETIYMFEDGSITLADQILKNVLK